GYALRGPKPGEPSCSALVQRPLGRSEGLLVQAEVLLQRRDQARDHLNRDYELGANRGTDYMRGLGLLDVALAEREHLAEGQGEVEWGVLDRAEVAVYPLDRGVFVRHDREVH